jgi:hypothetical protein
MIEFNVLKDYPVKTIDMKGKKYVMVNERVKAFRAACPTGQIVTEVIHIDEGSVMIKASVIDEGVTLATGTAYEEKASSYINKSSFVENCETSAVGRALGFLGIGIDDSMGSADEVANAMLQQGQMKMKETARTTIDLIKARALAAKCAAAGVDERKLCALYSVNSFVELTEEYHSNIINHWDQVVEKCKRQEK